MLYTASYYDPQDWVGQPYRVSRAHPRGRKTQWGTLSFLYPPLELLRAYRDGQIDFDALSSAYRRNLDEKFLVDYRFRKWLENLPSSGDVTLLCFERGDDPCHRRVAAHWLRERVPGLELGELN
jgi:uncharacterized protein YeaO (DUF488 family)